MSKTNVIMTDWLALIRRVLGSSPSGHGELIFITQLWNRIDIIAREMCNSVIYTICHYLKTCKKCKRSWRETSQEPEPMHSCKFCGHIHIIKHSHILEIYKFNSMLAFKAWSEWGENSFFRHFYVRDIELYFKYYSTLQWDNLFSEYY